MTSHDDRPTPAVAAKLLWSERYPTASALFCGGSVIRGEGRASSDLDVVVLFDSVPAAWRESFMFHGWPVEVFGHDPETLTYFVHGDCERGRPALAQMLSEAIVVPGPNAWSERIRAWATQILASPPVRTSAALDAERYAIGDLLDDFRDERPREQRLAIASALHPLVHNHLLSSQGRWCGSTKWLPALARDAAPELAAALALGFEAFFQRDEREPLVTAIEQIIGGPSGGIFDGFRSDAPAAQRVARADVPWLSDE